MGKLDVLHQLIHVDLECGQLRRRQRVNEVKAAHAREEGGLLVRDPSLGIPEHGRGQTHLPAKILR